MTSTCTQSLLNKFPKKGGVYQIHSSSCINIADLLPSTQHITNVGEQGPVCYTYEILVRNVLSDRLRASMICVQRLAEANGRAATIEAI